MPKRNNFNKLTPNHEARKAFLEHITFGYTIIELLKQPRDI